jgi:hypothetical protein
LDSSCFLLFKPRHRLLAIEFRFDAEYHRAFFGVAAIADKSAVFCEPSSDDPLLIGTGRIVQNHRCAWSKPPAKKREDGVTRQLVWFVSQNLGHEITGNVLRDYPIPKRRQGSCRVLTEESTSKCL